MHVHTLTTDQLVKLVRAIEDGSDFPLRTDDPKVNFAVDCMVAGDDACPAYYEAIYLSEIEAFKETLQKKRQQTSHGYEDGAESGTK